jgi:hypothetical protein
MNRVDRIKRVLLYILVASVLLGAGLGIAAVLRNTWTWFEVRVLLTTAILAGASVCGLACDLSRTPQGWNLLPITGLMLTLAATAVLLSLIWDTPVTHGAADFLSRAAWCLSVAAIATAHVSLLSVARLAPRFFWMFPVAYVVIYGLASMLCAVAISERVEEQIRPIAVLAILDVAVTLVIPLLHRLSLTDISFAQRSLMDDQNLAAIDVEIEKLQRRLKELLALRERLLAGK